MSVLENRRWLRASETAAVLAISLQNVYRMHRRGQLPSFKLPGVGIRVDRKALEEQIESEKKAVQCAINPDGRPTP